MSTAELDDLIDELEAGGELELERVLDVLRDLRETRELLDRLSVLASASLPYAAADEFRAAVAAARAKVR